MSDGYSVVPEGPEDVDALAEEEAEAVNQGRQSEFGTSRIHPREDKDSAVPPRSGVGDSSAGTEATSEPPVPEQEGEDAYDDPARDDQFVATQSDRLAHGGDRPVTSGEKRVRYVGANTEFSDEKSGITFKKGQRATVSGDEAARLTARRDFVSAD